MRKIKEAAVVHRCQVFTGKRHSDAIRKAVESTGIKPVIGAQGFVTEDGEFVDRKSAAVIAFKAGQIAEPKKKLYSEDLY